MQVSEIQASSTGFVQIEISKSRRSEGFSNCMGYLLSKKSHFPISQVAAFLVFLGRGATAPHKNPFGSHVLLFETKV